MITILIVNIIMLIVLLAVSLVFVAGWIGAEKKLAKYNESVIFTEKVGSKENDKDRR